MLLANTATRPDTGNLICPLSLLATSLALSPPLWPFSLDRHHDHHDAHCCRPDPARPTRHNWRQVSLGPFKHSVHELLAPFVVVVVVVSGVVGGAVDVVAIGVIGVLAARYKLLTLLGEAG